MAAEPVSVPTSESILASVTDATDTVVLTEVEPEFFLRLEINYDNLSNYLFQPQLVTPGLIFVPEEVADQRQSGSSALFFRPFTINGGKTGRSGSNKRSLRQATFATNVADGAATGYPCR